MKSGDLILLSNNNTIFVYEFKSVENNQKFKRKFNNFYSLGIVQISDDRIILFGKWVTLIDLEKNTVRDFLMDNDMIIDIVPISENKIVMIMSFMLDTRFILYNIEIGSIEWEIETGYYQDKIIKMLDDKIILIGKDNILIINLITKVRSSIPMISTNIIVTKDKRICSIDKMKGNIVIYRF